MPTVVAFISQKGGVGKSTLARALAREAAAGGLGVKIADLDTQQGTSVDWHRQRLDGAIEPTVAVEAFKTASQALSVANAYDLLIVDGPARTSRATLEIAGVADLVVQPTGASADDLRPAIREFHALAAGRRSRREARVCAQSDWHRQRRNRDTQLHCRGGLCRACQAVFPSARPIGRRRIWASRSPRRASRN